VRINVQKKSRDLGVAIRFTARPGFLLDRSVGSKMSFNVEFSVV
jgi:hypothetical protein